MASDFRQAQDIRTMVGIMGAQHKIDSEDTEGFAIWSLKALQVANSIDPTKMQLRDVIASTSFLQEIDDAPKI